MRLFLFLILIWSEIQTYIKLICNESIVLEMAEKHQWLFYCRYLCFVFTEKIIQLFICEKIKDHRVAVFIAITSAKENRF